MYIVHDVPGRLRVKLEKLRNNPHRLDKVKALLVADGVYRVKSNAVTGSVIIEYDKLAIDSRHIIDIFTANGYEIDTRGPKDKMAEQHEKIAISVGKATFSWLAGRVLEANGLAYIAAFI